MGRWTAASVGIKGVQQLVDASCWSELGVDVVWELSMEGQVIELNVI